MATRRALTAALVAFCLSGASTAAAAPGTPEERKTRRIWGPAETVSFWSAAVTRSIDGDGARLRGICVAREIFDEAEADMGGGLWASTETGGRQTVVRAGFSYRATLVQAGAGGVPPPVAPRGGRGGGG